ncbi:MAG: HupE/UreJ family protein [Ichthyobacteriaceae bacterium]|nr:HupE/UreJ family protein [Ichthyobacteriaceae bacterium]
MNTFITFLELGMTHILNTNGFGHILFIIALTVLYSIKEWKELFILITSFTIGHSITLVLIIMDLISYNSVITEAFIALSIAVAAILNIVRGGKIPAGKGLKVYYVLALFFGIIHGVGFANYLKALIGNSNELFYSISGFNIGVELGQLAIVGVIILISFGLDILLKIQKQQFILVTSSVILGVTLPMLAKYNWLGMF